MTQQQDGAMNILASDLPAKDSHCHHDHRVSCSNCRLGSLCLPIAVSTEDIEQIDNIVLRSRPIDKGHHLFNQGDTFKSIFAVRSGAIKTYSLSPSGKEQINGFYLPGEIFGMDGISDFSHASSAVALERSAVCEIPYDSLGKLSNELPSLQRHFMQLMSREIANDQKLISLLGKNSADERIAALILSLSARNVRRKYSATEFHLPMSRTDIANFLGLTIETVSRILSKFSKQGVIDLRNKELKILNIEQVRQIAGIE